MKRSHLLLAGMLAAAAPLTSACGSKTSFRPPCPAGLLCLEYGNGADPTTLDPHKVSGDWEYHIVEAMMVGLTAQDAAGRTMPGMATRWETSPDGLVWTFHLRDALWSDGAPVTADDFVFGLRREMDPKTAGVQASQIYAIKNAQGVNAGKLPVTALGVRAVDPKTVEITLEHPWPILPNYAVGPLMFPAPRHVVEKWGDAWVTPGHYVGNGPYSLVSWTIGDKIVLKKNPLYYEAPKVCIDRITYYPTTDVVSAERRVKRGELDISNGIASNRVAFLRRPDQMPAYVRVYPFVGNVFTIFNVKDVPVLKDRRVRQAIAMSIDREFITGKLLRGGQTAAYGYVPPGMVDYDSAPRVYWAGWSLARRQAEARRLLLEAGYGPGHRLKVEAKYRMGSDPALSMTAIQADLAAVGVRVTLAGNETQVAYAAYEVKDFQIGDGGWVGASDAMGYLYIFRRDTGEDNLPGYDNPAYDAALNAANAEKDLKARAAHLQRAEEMLLEDLPIAPLYFPSSRNLVNPNVTGWVDNRLDSHKERFLCFRDADARRKGLR